MNSSAETSGLPLLATYAVLLIASLSAAVGALFAAESIVPSLSGAIFMSALGAAVIGPWFLAVWITEPAAPGVVRAQSDGRTGV